MKCPHCAIGFHDNWETGSVERTVVRRSSSEGVGRVPLGTGWFYRTAVCPKCSKLTIELSPPLKPELWEQLKKEQKERNKHEYDNVRTKFIMNNGKWRQVHPIRSKRGPVPPEVPQQIAGDYVEACQVLPTSAKASAALSRRCLQAILHAHGYKDKDLAKEVDQLLKAKVLPTHIHKTVDAIRNFGNFGAHPISDKSSLQIIDVQPQEAEWCIEILEALFDHFYVQPTAAGAKKAALDAKLTAAGKPRSK